MLVQPRTRPVGIFRDKGIQNPVCQGGHGMIRQAPFWGGLILAGRRRSTGLGSHASAPCMAAGTPNSRQSNQLRA